MGVTIQANFSPQTHAAILAGKDTSFPRGRAISLVPTSGLPEPVTLLRKILENEAEPAKYRRLAAIALWRVNSEEARELLLAAASTIKDPAVLGGIVKVLGRVGDERALAALEALQGRTEGHLAEQVAFAVSLLAHRFGLPGHELPVPPPGDAVPRSLRSRFELLPPAEEEVKRFGEGLKSEPYGIEVDPKALWQVRCATGLWMLAFSRSFAAASPASLNERKAVVGLLASRSDEDGDYSVAYLLLAAPNRLGKGLDLHVRRSTGEVAWAGSVQLGENGTLDFSIYTAGRLGIVAVELAGSWSGSERKLELSRAVSASAKIEKLVPVALERPPF